MKKLQSEIDNSSVPVNEDFNNDFQFIFRNCDQNRISAFMKLFWEEQIKYLNSSSQIRYHPMVIKYCLGLYAKSPACYEQVRLNEKEGSGILVLPSQRTLRDYKNYIRPERGFNPKVIEELALKTKDFSSVETFICICFDEMKIQDDLVWDKLTGELIGFVDLGDVNLNYASLNDVHEIARRTLSHKKYCQSSIIFFRYSCHYRCHIRPIISSCLESSSYIRKNMFP